MNMKWLAGLTGFEVIDGNGAVRRYLRRWRLLSLPNGRRLYLHHFVGSDWAGDLHDHPKRFVSIGLLGGYVEERPSRPAGRRFGAPWPSRERARVQYRAPWFRSFDPQHAHRLRVPRRGCWTLCYVGPPVKDWGWYRMDGRSMTYLPWRQYVRRYGGRRPA